MTCGCSLSLSPLTAVARVWERHPFFLAYTEGDYLTPVKIKTLLLSAWDTIGAGEGQGQGGLFGGEEPSDSSRKRVTLAFFDCTAGGDLCRLWRRFLGIAT
jgi:hypothetical protein